MSEPVKNAEVEDVLSSIRRLVSEDKRPLQVPQVDAEPEPATDRLVLTPALRVAEGVPAAVVQDDVAQDMPHADEAPDALDALLAETVAQEAETAGPAPQALAENYDDDPYNFADAADVDGETTEALLLTDPQLRDDQAEEPSEEVAEEPAAQEAEPVDLEDTPKEEAVQADTPEEEIVEAKHDDPLPEELELPQTAEPDTLSAKIAALETAIGGIRDEWEPDGAGQDAYAGSEPEAMAWEDDAPEDSVEETPEPSEPEVIDAAEVEEVTEEAQDVAAAPADGRPADTADQPDAAAEIAGFALGAEDQLLDEETLREMISEIVHQELQGALGTRITRNVRRLVRREIHRALTARDLG